MVSLGTLFLFSGAFNSSTVVISPAHFPIPRGPGKQWSVWLSPILRFEAVSMWERRVGLHCQSRDSSGCHPPHSLFLCLHLKAG